MNTSQLILLYENLYTKLAFVLQVYFDIWSVDLLFIQWRYVRHGGLSRLNSLELVLQKQTYPEWFQVTKNCMIEL